jgi:Insertion element 4 transposase N-terminal/Transposase DDE domain
MPTEGRCVLPADAAGNVLDRLTGLQQFITPQQVRQALHDTGRLSRRDCVLTAEVILWVVLAMGLLTDLPLRQVFKHARRLRPGEKTPRRGALCMARQRLGSAPVRHLFGQVARPLATPQTPGAFYKGLRKVGIDGTLLDLPDTPDNARIFGRPTGGRGDGAFPQLRKLSLVELGTHAELAFVLKPCRRGEISMVAGLLRQLHAGMVLLWDRAFFSYHLWQQLTARGIHVLARVKSHLVLRPVQTLADGSYLAKIYPSPADRDQDQGGIVVRVIKYTLTDPQRTGYGQEHTLLTTLVDAAEHPAVDLACAYHERWEEELTFDEQKTHQDPRRPTKPWHLRSQSPAGVVQEAYALSLGHYVTRALMAQAAARTGQDPDRLSFLGCLQILRCRLPECDSSSPATWREWYEALLWEMGQETIEPRRHRVNPRVVRRKMSKFKKARPCHRRRPPLTKRFRDTVVVNSP